jgi:DNA-binding LacI/PurR family transcriptional regulator
LIGLGRRRIAAIGDQPGKETGTASLRLAGYRDAVTAAGIRFEPDLVMPVERYQRADGAAAMRRLLELAEPPDAVFCCNDLLAIGAMRAALARGLAVPEQLAVAGFDDIEEGAYSCPSLTTVAPDKTVIAHAAVDLVARRRRDRASMAPQDAQAPFQLVIRESTAGVA